MGSVQAQVEHSKVNPRWRLPATHHTFTVPLGSDGSVQFFVLDTQTLGDQQVAWLDRELAASKATWKLVYGHFPLYSHSIRGHNGGMIRRLEPTLVKHKVDLYMAGHDHTLEMLRPVKGVNYLVSGGGGGPDMSYAVTWHDEETLYAATGGGFVALRIGKDDLVIEFIRLDAKTQWCHVIPRPGARLGPY
jgi:tartrate-resistant acid phosphatase type 5